MALNPEVLLPQLMSQLERQFTDLEILDQTAHAIFGGCQAILIRSCFALRNAEGQAFRCLSRSHTHFARQLVFSVGISCAAQGEYRVDEDTEMIARSNRPRRTRA